MWLNIWNHLCEVFNVMLLFFVPIIEYSILILYCLELSLSLIFLTIVLLYVNIIIKHTVLSLVN